MCISSNWCNRNWFVICIISTTRSIRTWCSRIFLLSSISITIKVACKGHRLFTNHHSFICSVYSIIRSSYKCVVIITTRNYCFWRCTTSPVMGSYIRWSTNIKCDCCCTLSSNYYRSSPCRVSNTSILYKSCFSRI